VKLTRLEFAKKCGVTKMAISKAVRRGEVVEDEKGRVNTADPGNRAYMLADHAVMKRAEVAGRAKKSKEARGLMDEKTFEQTRQYRENANWAVQRRAKDLGLLVERAKVEQMMAAFGQELKFRLLGMPRQTAPELFALAKVKGSTPMALEGLLLKRISETLERCKDKARAVGLGSLSS
jgi:hypothetical protein